MLRSGHWATIRVTMVSFEISFVRAGAFSIEVSGANHNQMKKESKFIVCSIAMLAILLHAFETMAQCGAGEVEITLECSTDNWGYEAYFELVPQGNGCGNGTIYAGGNTAQLDCNSGGAPYTGTAGNGFGNNTVVSVDNICVSEDMQLDLEYIDDYGDGGLEIQIFVDGYVVGTMQGTGTGNTYSFTASLPAARDMRVDEIRSPYSYVQPGSNTIAALFTNVGIDPITDMIVNYQVDNGPVEFFQLNGLFIPNFDSHLVEHVTPWDATLGGHTVKVWASDLNGNSDMNPDNDLLEIEVEVGPGIPNILDGYLGLPAYDFQEHGSSSDGLDGPTDLDFFPVLSKNELWVVNEKTEANGGSTTTYFNVGTQDQTHVTREDANNWHFMSLPTGIAFGENENFGTSPGVFDANHNGGTPFTGPSLWSSDTAVYARPSGGNGSHLDMLHESPECQGIAHETGNVYWVFDGYGNDIVRYDFVEDHGPGHDFHGDALIHRYSDDPVAKDPQGKVVSHLVIDKDSDWLYVVDNGNQRIFRIDITTGNFGGTPPFVGGEPVSEYRYITGYTQEDVVTSGLVRPAGIDLVEDRMIVSDYETSEIIIYDISSMPATELGRINTGATGIMGVKIGPEGRIWYVDYDAEKLYRIEGAGVGLEEQAQLKANVFPNPSNDSNVILSTQELGVVDVRILDMKGKVIYSEQFSQRTELNLDLNSGIYVVEMTQQKTGLSSAKRLVITN